MLFANIVTSMGPNLGKNMTCNHLQDTNDFWGTNHTYDIKI